MVWSDQKAYHVVQLGRHPRAAEIARVLNESNRIQGEFAFEAEGQRELPDLAPFTHGGAVDLDAVAREVARGTDARPLVLITGEPYLDAGKDGPEPYFSNFWVEDAHEVMLISTHLWETLHPGRPLEPYLLNLFGTLILSHRGGLEYHDETAGCAFDADDDPADIDRAIAAGGLCGRCETEIRNHRVDYREVAAARRLLRAAAGRDVCFVAIPYGPRFARVRDTIRQAAADVGWDGEVADETAFAGNLFDWTMHGILASSTVIADVTDHSANVLFEVGFAFAHGRDTVLLSQNGPGQVFNLEHRPTVTYSPDEAGLAALRERLAALLRQRRRAPVGG